MTETLNRVVLSFCGAASWRSPKPPTLSLSLSCLQAVRTKIAELKAKVAGGADASKVQQLDQLTSKLARLLAPAVIFL